MNKRRAQVGFSQRIRLEWLENTTNLILAGNDETAVKDALRELLADKISVGGHSNRSNREKMITIMTKTWLNVPRGLEELRDEGLGLIRDQHLDQHNAVHWGMVLAVYPFWGAVAAQTGRLLRLQGNVAAVQVQRRMKEGYGERQTVSRSTRNVLRSFMDWRVLTDTATKGVYSQGLRSSVMHPKLVAWLAEAVLRSQARESAGTRDLLEHPAIFPFNLAHLSAARLVSNSPRLETLRHGLNEDLVMLRRFSR